MKNNILFYEMVDIDPLKIYEKEKKIIGSAVHIRFYPMIIDRMLGKNIWDINGKKYLDFNASWAVANIGHSHPKVSNSIRKQVKKFFSASYTTFPYIDALEYAEKIKSVCPSGKNKKVIFGHSGSDINDGVYKLALVATRKQRFLSFIGSYHGQTLGSYSVSGHKAQALLTPYREVIKIPYPYCYRCPFGLEYPSCGMKCVDYIKYLLSTIAPPDTIAGIFVEPIQSDGGDVIPPQEFHKKLEKLAKEHGILFIMDEVKVGMGRTGSLFASTTYNVSPDIITLGKPIASGLPLSLGLIRKDLADIKEASHLFTLSPNPLSIAAASATLDVLLENRIVDKVRSKGEYLMKRMNELKDNHDIVGDVRGLGLIAGIELVKNRRTKEPAIKETAKVVYRAWELGLITVYTGLYSNVIELTPPLIIDKDDIDRAIYILDEAIKDVEMNRIPDEKIRLFTGW